MWNQIQTLDDASLVVRSSSQREITRGRRGRERANRQKKGGGGGGGGGSRICAHLLNFSFWRFSTPFFSLEKIKGRVFLGGGVKKEGGDLKRDLIGALLLSRVVARVELARRRRPLPKNTDGRRLKRLFLWTERFWGLLRKTRRDA